MSSLRSTLVVLLLAAGCSGQGDEKKKDPAPSEHDAGEPVALKQRQATAWRPLEPDEMFEGKSLSEWAIEWMRWSFAQTSCDASNFDPDGSLCRLYQEDTEHPVFFMAYAPSEHPRTRCTVPQGRAIMVPLANFWFDDVDSSKTRTPEQLDQAAEKALESIRDLRLSADGEDVAELERYIVRPVQFSYRVPPAPNWYSCNGTDGVADQLVEPAVLSGYFALFPPPARGAHELKYGGVLTYEGEDVSLQMVNRFEVVDE